MLNRWGRGEIGTRRQEFSKICLKYNLFDKKGKIVHNSCRVSKGEEILDREVEGRLSCGFFVSVCQYLLKLF